MELTPKIQRDLWKICNKIREVTNHIKFNFWEYYSTYDVKNTGYVTVFIFKNVLSGPLKTTINLSDEEIQLLENYFENPNGQVQYGKFCQMIHNETNLKKESMKTENTNLKYTKQDLPRLNVMKKIASDLNTLHILLEPYFKDYEELTGNDGLMTIKQFKDMFYALKIQISPQEMQLIINKFIVFSYMIDKNQFFEELNWVRINNPQSFFTEVIKDKVKENSRQLYSNQNVFHPVISSKTQKQDNVITVLRNIQKHVLENRMNIKQFFEAFDPFRKGYVSEKQFRRCLDMIGVSSIHSLHYSEAELSLLLQMYKNKAHPERIQWKNFEDQINTVFTEKKLETDSDVEIKCSLNALDMLRIRGQDWEAVELNLRKLFNETMVNIRNYLNQRRILLDQYFKIFDKNNHGHISRSDFRRAMFTASIQCTEEELGILEKRFMNADGFNYLEFFKMLNNIDKSIKQCSATRNDFHTYNDETSSESIEKINYTTINKLMTKIKTIVKRRRIKIDQFLSQFDILNHRVMPKDSFRRALGIAGVNVDSNELEILFNEFESKTHPGCVEYCRFCDAVETAFVTLGLERTPSAYPREFLPTYEAPANCLTDEERSAVDSALLKLRSKPNIGLDDLFKDYDRLRQGVVSMIEFLGALTVRKLNMLLSAHEIKCLMKAFSKDEHRPITFNYRAFMKTVECT